MIRNRVDLRRDKNKKKLSCVRSDESSEDQEPARSLGPYVRSGVCGVRVGPRGSARACAVVDTQRRAASKSGKGLWVSISLLRRAATRAAGAQN